MYCDKKSMVAGRFYKIKLVIQCGYIIYGPYTKTE